MAKSKYEYVKSFEIQDCLLQNTWIVVRVDGRNFHKFSENHYFTKPNDIRALNLMNRAAIKVMLEFKDIIIAYGQSDEYSFVLRKDTMLFNRRGSKIMTYINSMFSASYVYYWREYFDIFLKYPPVFDSRIVLYPSNENLRDYLSWRQVDCHINNLYNTTFWTLIQKGGLTNSEAEQKLCGTFSADKHELLFSQFGINYNNELELFKKGTTLLRKKVKHPMKSKSKQIVLPLNVDMIADSFWAMNNEVLDISPPSDFEWINHFDTCEAVLRQLNLSENVIDDSKQ